ncbi:MAG: hypothetical protein FWE31_04730 [Firmicutes bacterium]|nr:hypothetical protein [Bacillota bacterium]
MGRLQMFDKSTGWYRNILKEPFRELLAEHGVDLDTLSREDTDEIIGTLFCAPALVMEEDGKEKMANFLSIFSGDGYKSSIQDIESSI